MTERGVAIGIVLCIVAAATLFLSAMCAKNVHNISVAAKEEERTRSYRRIASYYRCGDLCKRTGLTAVDAVEACYRNCERQFGR